MTYQCHLYYEEQTQFRARERSTIASLVFMGLLEIWYDICNFCFIKNSDVRDCGNELLRVAPRASLLRTFRFVFIRHVYRYRNNWKRVVATSMIYDRVMYYF